MFRALGSERLTRPQPGLDSSSSRATPSRVSRRALARAAHAQRRGRAAGLFRAGQHLPSAGRAPRVVFPQGAVTRRPAIASLLGFDLISAAMVSEDPSGADVARATRLFGGRWASVARPCRQCSDESANESADESANESGHPSAHPTASWKRRAIAPATRSCRDQPARHRGSARSHA